MCCNCEECKCGEDHTLVEDADDINSLEFILGNALNINFTNHYKRQLLHDVVELYVKEKRTTQYDKPIDEWKTELLKDLQKIEDADSGSAATKVYVDIVAKFL